MKDYCLFVGVCVQMYTQIKVSLWCLLIAQIDNLWQAFDSNSNTMLNYNILQFNCIDIIMPHFYHHSGTLSVCEWGVCLLYVFVCCFYYFAIDYKLTCQYNNNELHYNKLKTICCQFVFFFSICFIYIVFRFLLFLPLSLFTFHFKIVVFVF